MKTLSIIPEDNMVVVDGKALKLTVNDIDPDIHAIQWDEEKQEGSIEYKSELGNRSIGPSEIAPFLVYANSYQTEKDKRIKDTRKAEEEQDAYLVLPDTKRMQAFSQEMRVGDQLDEILKYIDSKGDADGNLKAIINKSKEIKDRFPKEGE